MNAQQPALPHTLIAALLFAAFLAAYIPLALIHNLASRVESAIAAALGVKDEC